MDINSFIETPTRKHTHKKKLPLKSLSIISITFICFIFLSLCTGNLIFNMYKYNSLKHQYKIATEQATLLSNTSMELSKSYASKKAEYDTILKKYNELIANSPVAYLTFDDGPSDNTLKILDVLDKYNAKATFFVVYKEGYDHIYNEIVKRGHVLGNHTYSHIYKDIYSSPEGFINNVIKLDKKLEEITGVPPAKILRFPGGSKSSFIPEGTTNEIKFKLNELGYSYYDWNVDSTDASALTQPKNLVVNGVLEGADLVNTANVLMHDMNIKYTTLEALPEIIEGLKSKGYRFKTLDHNSVKIQF